jgi:hypothetical protein
LLRDALEAVWMVLTLPVKQLVADALHDALERERRELVASVTWTDRDDAAVDAYTREPE